MLSTPLYRGFSEVAFCAGRPTYGPLCGIIVIENTICYTQAISFCRGFRAIFEITIVPVLLKAADLLRSSNHVHALPWCKDSEPAGQSYKRFGLLCLSI